MRTEHLTDIAFLGLAGNRLSESARQAVEEHLAGCAACRKEFAEFQLAHAVIERVAEVGYREALPQPSQKGKSPRSKQFVFAWKPAIAVTVVFLCVFALFFNPGTMPTVRASGLLSEAMSYESRSGDAPFYSVNVSGQTCAVGKANEKLVSLDSSVRCGQALRKIRDTSWGHGNPLSAKAYANWRSSLPRRHDRVTKHDAFWEIQTTADEGTVHAASLELRVDNYRTSKLTLDLAGNEEISILEAAEAPPTIPITETATTPNMQKMPPQFVDNQGDLSEVQAWELLHQLNADTGWEAIVLRRGPEVQVKAIVRDEARKTELAKAFADLPHVVLDIHLPDHPGDLHGVIPGRITPVGDSQPLATGWLNQRFSDADNAVEFSNQALRSSRTILGRAFILDRLERRQAALSRCSCAKDLSELVASERRALSAAQIELSADIQPLVGSTRGSDKVLTLAEAQNLDASIHDLLWQSSTASKSTLDMRVQQVRRLLSQN
ncbi:anti-sigma factor family protein [Silvibacterium acidisoli]|uniref:anti-sigma factor family protein n=1 Tax=Acidobacteriaceae bacterium ZG23-2 TaxID=2883246 RepID=UPI00406C4AB0